MHQPVRRKTIFRLAVFVLLLLPLPAGAQLLDELLPPAIPGYGQRFSVIAQHRQFAPGATGWNFGSITAAPSLSASAGYDSAPGGSSASPTLQTSPSLLLTDPVAGFGLYGEANFSTYPANHSQDTKTALIAAGERINPPRQTVMISAAYLHGAVTGFAFDTQEITRPIPFDLQDVRVSDRIASGLFTLTPDFSFTRYVFSGMSAVANRVQPRAALTIAYVPGGPLSALLRAGTTQLDYSDASQDAGIYELLAGLQDQADGLWTISLLAGAASRQPRQGASLTTPVLEARADWMPTMLDEISLAASREIDDPDAISATPYTRSSLKLLLNHQLLENVTINTLADFATANYIHTNLQEFLATAKISVQWQVSSALTVEAIYCFNTRQSNALRAANEHVVTAGLTWAL
ncbi:MAG TPA: outer membrane beta-barrel protein [Acidocella sp.]|jgi:hypothetical protein|nr:outer membrane beta-barrel protein [Acidocella sp.]